MKLSPNEIAFVAAKYWTGPELVVSVAVALGESGGDTEALGRSTTGTSVGNRDHGLWQISNRWHQLRGDGSPGRLLLAGAQWRDPYVNARLAREVFDESIRAGKDGWLPWHVYTSGAYKTYLPDAEIAVKAPWAPPVSDVAAAIGALKVDLVNEIGGSAGDLEISLKAELADAEATLTELVKRPHVVTLTSQIQP
jgi:hypothetical protein